MTPFKKLFLVLLVGVLTLGIRPWNTLAASNNKKMIKEVPGVETKVKQVPGEGGYTVPLWKVHWEKARQGVLLKKYPEAVQDFRQALTLKPNLDEARQELAQVLITLERWAEAISELEIVAEHNPLNLKVQKDLGDLLSQRKEYRRAIERYQWILQKDPDNLQIRLLLASNYYQINELEKALIEWRQVLIRDPQNVESRTYMADVLGATRRLDESILLLEGLVKQFPKQFSLKKKLAQALVSTQRNKEALPYLQELFRQDPADLEIQLLLAQALSAGKYYDESLTYLDTYLKNKPDNSMALLEKARALFNTGNHSLALEVYERLKKAEPKNLDFKREIAEAYYLSGRITPALAEFEQLAKHFPDEYQLQEKVGDLHFQNKDYEQAIKAYQKVLSLDKDNFFSQLNLARAYHLSGQKDQALTLYRSILSKRNDPKIQVEMADLLYEVKQFPEAFKIYQQLLEGQPDLWEVRLKLASGLYRQKEFGLAARHLEVLVQIRPDNAGIWTLAGFNALEQGEFSQAQKAFQKALTLGDDQSNSLLRLGEISRLQGFPWKEINYLDWALTIKPGDQEILLEKALALTDGGGWSQARKILEPMVNSNPKGFKVQRIWFRLLAAQDRRDECEAGWEELEKNFPLEKSLIFQDRADFYARKKKTDMALTALKAAQLKNPKYLEIQRKIGRLLIQMGQWQEAETYYQNLENEKLILDEVYLGQAIIFIHQRKYELAKERLWKAMMKAPDSVRIRFWLWRLYARGKIGIGPARKIEESLLAFARSQEGGLLELAGCYQEIEDRKKAYSTYRDLIDGGEDDDVLLSAVLLSNILQAEGKGDELEEMLEDLQKRFPRNQKITRLLIEHYTQDKQYGQAVKAIDGLQRVEDPYDPVLIIKKARILERWNKHSASQALYQQLLEPSVDQVFSEKIKETFQPQDTMVASLLEEIPQTARADSFNGFFEETKRKIENLPFEPNQKNKLKTIIEELKLKGLIQQKVYLEKEGKDLLWRKQYGHSRSFFEKLREIDPDNEEVDQDLERSYRLQN